ncbi:PREDICTED: TBC1 domain family member 14-like [Dufourea novaeangliae]|uniref:TBC1 domain family member 14 n=1 Tax=Dufourea novaeangliae TaxID=178035 RepID=A0A154NZF7_DUFNO|nr:PREDICTED: TBC1 domain family member 14-like [Dufourea novaeangliae]KZC05059.1 TBC1 domain family member 14 [Dufourea novaeangliae]
MKSPVSQHLNGNSHSVSSQNVSPCIVSRYGNTSNNYQVLKVSGRDSNCYIANNIVPKIGKQQLVSLNGDSISCNSVNINEALACDVASAPAVKTKALCVHIRENKWYDAGNVVSVGVAGTSLNHALESMSLAYNPTTKQLYSLEEVNGSNDTQLDCKSQYLNSSCNQKEESTNGISKIDEDKYIRLESGSANSSPRNSLPRSCSSTVSSLSEVSPTGSFLSSDEQVPEKVEKSKRWGLNTIFSKNVFSWKNKDSQQSTPTSSPSRNVDKVGGSLALIQQPRPANLPAKNAVEEERHRKQYNAILEAARKRELREEKERKQQRELQLKEEARLAEDSQIWNVQILTKFESIKNTKKVRELWWRGLPPSVRGKVWKLAIPNDLNITAHLYNICLDRAMTSPLSDTLAAIKLDVSRTFPTLCVFQEGGPLSDSLQGILAAYAVYRPDVGYVQGMSFVGAILSLNMEPPDAFICFTNLLNHPCHRAAFTLDQKQMDIYYKVYSSALAHKLPKVFSHFTEAGLSPDLYLLDWLYTIYAKAMPLDVVCRIWDVFLRDGDEFLFRTALGVLHLYQEELLKMDFVHGAQFLTRLPENLQAEALFNSISQMSTTVGTTTFQQMLVEFSSL